MPKGTPTVYRMMNDASPSCADMGRGAPNDVGDLPLRAQRLAPVTPDDALVSGVRHAQPAAHVVSELHQEGAVESVDFLKTGQYSRIVIPIFLTEHDRQRVARTVVNEGERAHQYAEQDREEQKNSSKYENKHGDLLKNTHTSTAPMPLRRPQADRISPAAIVSLGTPHSRGGVCSQPSRPQPRHKVLWFAFVGDFTSGFFGVYIICRATKSPTSGPPGATVRTR